MIEIFKKHCVLIIGGVGSLIVLRGKGFEGEEITKIKTKTN